MHTLLVVLLSTCGIALLAGHLVSIWLYLRRPAPLAQRIGQPPLTLLRPVCGFDPIDAETLGSSFRQDYPAYSVIFCAPDAADPAVPHLRRLIAENPGVPAQILTGQVNHTANPKLNNLWKGWAAATTDWIVMTDSNLLLPPDYLSTVAATWDAGTGLVSSPAIGIRPQGFAASLECAFLNSNQARLQFAAARLGHGYAQGKTLFWNRPLLEKAGGLVGLGRFLAEDVSATKLVRAQGLAVTLPPRPYAQPIGRRRLTQVWQRQLRWSRVRRDGFPGLFLAEPLNGGLVPLAAAGAALWAAGLSLWWGLLPAALWYGSEVWLMRRAGWPCGGRDIAALPLRDLLIPAIWVATFRRRGFEWRGTTLRAAAAPLS